MLGSAVEGELPSGFMMTGRRIMADLAPVRGSAAWAMAVKLGLSDHPGRTVIDGDIRIADRRRLALGP